MAVEVIDKIKPKNGGSFPIAEAVDVEVSEGLRLSEALEAKANTADVTEETTYLQNQIDQIAQAAGTGTAETEIAQARVDADGTSYQTLKARLDADAGKVELLRSEVEASLPISTNETTFAESICNVARILKPVQGYWSCPEGDEEMTPDSLFFKKANGSSMYALAPIPLKAGVTYNTNDLRVFYSYIYDKVTGVYTRYYQVTTWKTKASSETITPTNDSILFASIQITNTTPMVVNGTLPSTFSPFGVPIGNSVVIPKLDTGFIQTIAQNTTSAMLAEIYPVNPDNTTFVEAVCNHAKLPDTTQESYWRSESNTDMTPDSIYVEDLDGSNMFSLEPIEMKAGVTYKTNDMRVYYCFVYDKVTGVYTRYYQVTTWYTKVAPITITPEHDSIFYASVPETNTQPMVVNGNVPSIYSAYGKPIGNTVVIPQLDKSSLAVDHTVITVKKDGTGDFTKVYDAVNSIANSNGYNIFDIHIYPGTYDVITEVFGSGEYTRTEGIVLPPNVNLIGIGQRDDIILKAEFPDTVTTEVSTAFSTINVDGSNNLENITFIAYNCRYACHDDDGNAAKSQGFVRNVKNCKFWHKGCYTDDGSVWKWCKAYGQGLSSGSTSNFEYCEFQTDTNISGNSAFSSHGNKNMEKPSYINFEHCKFTSANLDLCSTTNGLNDHVEQYVKYIGCEFSRSIGTGNNVEINKERYDSDGVYFNAYGVGNKNCYAGVGRYASGASNKLHFFANDNA